MGNGVVVVVVVVEVVVMVVSDWGRREGVGRWGGTHLIIMIPSEGVERQAAAIYW